MAASLLLVSAACGASGLLASWGASLLGKRKRATVRIDEPAGSASEGPPSTLLGPSGALPPSVCGTDVISLGAGRGQQEVSSPLAAAAPATAAAAPAIAVKPAGTSDSGTELSGGSDSGSGDEPEGEDESSDSGSSEDEAEEAAKGAEEEGEEAEQACGPTGGVAGPWHTAKRGSAEAAGGADGIFIPLVVIGDGGDSLLNAEAEPPAKRARREPTGLPPSPEPAAVSKVHELHSEADWEALQAGAGGKPVLLAFPAVGSMHSILEEVATEYGGDVVFAMVYDVKELEDEFLEEDTYAVLLSGGLEQIATYADNEGLPLSHYPSKHNLRAFLERNL